MEKTIYKRDSAGKVRFITYSTDSIGTLNQTSGIHNEPSSYIHNPKICQAKNVGKKSETTPEQQAIKELNSKLKKKLKGEYFENIQDIDTIVVGVMAATVYTKVASKILIGTPLYIDRKYDGMRCLAIVKDGDVKLQSRLFNDILVTNGNSMVHIKEQMSHFPNGIYDGELFNMELGSFQEQMSAIKSYKPGISEKINYNIYDLVNDPSYIKYIDRKTIIDSRIKKATQANIKSVKTEYYITTNTKKDTYDFIKRLHDQYVAEGFEGAIIRVGDCPYEMNKRSKNMLKFKEFFDTAAEIIDIVPQDANPNKGQPVCKVIKAEHSLIIGQEFRTGLAVNDQEQVDMLNNPHKYIGKIAEIRFFEATDSGIPRHGYYHGLRLDK